MCNNTPEASNKELLLTHTYEAWICEELPLLFKEPTTQTRLKF